MNKIKCEKAVFINDLHIPYHWKPTIDVVLEFIKWFRPQFVYIVGDMLDFYALSHFDKNPQRLLSLQNELDEAVLFLKHLRKATGRDCKIIFKEGNHCERLRKYLWKHPELSPLKVLTMRSLLELDNKNINVQLVEYNQHLEHRGFLITHGAIVRKNSSYTAKGMLEAKQVSGISAHTHRGGLCYKADESTATSGIKVWYENFCLCNLKPEYVEGTPDWQHGFTVGYWFADNHRFHCIQIPIIKSRLLIGSEDYLLSFGGDK